MEAKVTKINQISSLKCNQQREVFLFLSKSFTLAVICHYIIKELENVMFVKEREEKM